MGFSEELAKASERGTRAQAVQAAAIALSNGRAVSHTIWAPPTAGEVIEMAKELEAYIVGDR